MSAELSEHLAGWDSVHSALSELRATHGEARHFFADVFDQLGTMLTELAGRGNQWESQRKQAESELARKTAQLRQDRAALAEQQELVGQDAQASAANISQIERLLDYAQQQRAEIRDAQQQFQAEVARLADAAGDDQLTQVLEEIRQQRSESRGAQEAVQQQVEQLATMAAELANVRGELLQTRNEIAHGREQIEARQETAAAGADEELQQRFCQLQGQQASLEQERAILESELEAVRNRAAEMTQSLAEQKQQAAAQQAEWAAELKRMRRLLEIISAHLAETERSEGAPQPGCRQAPAVAAGEGPTAAGGDPVLDSVAAQFEMLQRDLAKRRAAKSA
jgi:DNA repair exonuclease SbcCD ATPase subunit